MSVYIISIYIYLGTGNVGNGGSFSLDVGATTGAIN
tara:strand:- start:3 stop:110 length:108 start_codon:yes stop_codon:yes gene_type:complete